LNVRVVSAWSQRRKYRNDSGPQLLPSRKKLRKIKSVKHLAALPYGQLGAFMSELQQRPGGQRSPSPHMAAIAAAGEDSGRARNRAGEPLKARLAPRHFGFLGQP